MKIEIDSESIKIDSIPDTGVNMDAYIQDIEFAFYAYALKRFNGHRQQAADFLGMKRTTLIMRCQKYGIFPESIRASDIIKRNLQ